VVGLPLWFGGQQASARLIQRLDLQLDLSGPSSMPHLTATGVLRNQADAAGPVTFAADWASRQLQFTIDEEQRTGGRLSVSGTLPVGLPLLTDEPFVLQDGDRVEATVEIVNFDLASLTALVDPGAVRALQGLLQAEVRLAGSVGVPQLSGEASITRFRARLDELGAVLVADDLDIALNDDRITITDAEIQDGHRGALRITGGVNLMELDRLELDVGVELDRFQAARGRPLGAMLSGALAVQGTVEAPEIRGSVYVNEATYWVDNQDTPTGLEPVALTEADYAELERRYGITQRGDAEEDESIWDAMALDLAVAGAPSNIWVRRAYEPNLAIEVTGDVRATKAPGGELHLEGTVDMLTERSFIKEFGQRFDITAGQIRFDGPPRSFRFDVRSTYEPDEDVEIALEARVTEEELTLTLDSTPELSQEDIISYIAVGRPASEIRQIDEVNEGATRIGAEVALSRIREGVEDFARRSTGLDVVEIQQDGFHGLTLVAGTYQTRRLYFGFRQPVVFQGNQENEGSGLEDTEGTVEYRVNDWLLANLAGSRSLVRFFLEVSHAY
jgi:translocation and assembly module TamB